MAIIITMVHRNIASLTRGHTQHLDSMGKNIKRWRHTAESQIAKGKLWFYFGHEEIQVVRKMNNKPEANEGVHLWADLHAVVTGHLKVDMKDRKIK